MALSYLITRQNNRRSNSNYSLRCLVVTLAQRRSCVLTYFLNYLSISYAAEVDLGGHIKSAFWMKSA